MARREDFGDCKFLDSGFILDEESDDSVLSSSTDLMEDDSSSSSSSSNSSSDHLLDLSLLMANLPIKRGLSQFFQGKSESFSCLSEVSCIEDLAKKNNLYSKRSKYCKRNDEGMHMNQKSHYAPNIFSRIISKKPLMYSSDPMLARNRSSNLFCTQQIRTVFTFLSPSRTTLTRTPKAPLLLRFHPAESNESSFSPALSAREITDRTTRTV
ncbi:hypothetical protein IEQ34_003613 [Dendrobium chrysotoxum]|uniref:Uncharacterized protein n=1 Tax=Dendrobium chrysotoxum TaxID=161865 RepID=A0AAV7HK69_DENCH|nr:hypothetical protein IEQ34_003613 [Dendrobium chrysotoxum]